MRNILFVILLLQFLNSKSQTTNADTTINKLVGKIWMLDSCGAMGFRNDLVPYLNEYMIGKDINFLVNILGKPDWVDDQPLYSRFHFSVSSYKDSNCCCIKEKGFVLSTITFDYDRKTKKILNVEYRSE